MSSYKFDTIESAIEDIKLGKMVIVIDDEDRENEGDFIMAADRTSPESINFMAKFGRGLICTPITKEKADQLGLKLMIESQDSIHSTAFTVSIDSIHAGTGISAKDRAITIEALTNPSSKTSDFLMPGHIFPLIAKDGGVLERPGHTEAAVDLARLAGCDASGVICEIMNDDGSMARTDDLALMAKKHNLKFITIKDLINFRKKNQAQTFKINKTLVIDFPNKYGNFDMHLFEVDGKKEHHLAITKGFINSDITPLVRIHSECLTGDLFGSKRCDCGEQLETSLKEIEKRGEGVVIYLRQEGRGIGLPSKMKAYQLQDKGLDTVEANRALGFGDDLRDYNYAAEMLKQLGISKVELLTNNPKKIIGLEQAGISVISRRPLEIRPNSINLRYLKTKRDKMNHMILNSI